jgi:hypothetical protein
MTSRDAVSVPNARFFVQNECPPTTTFPPTLSTPPSCANWCTLPSPPQERLGIDRLEFRLDDCDDIGDSASQLHGALHRDRKGHLPGKETFSKRLGRFLRDPSVWCAGFQVSVQCSVLSVSLPLLTGDIAQCWGCQL